MIQQGTSDVFTASAPHRATIPAAVWVEIGREAASDDEMHHHRTEEDVRQSVLFQVGMHGLNDWCAMACLSPQHVRAVINEECRASDRLLAAFGFARVTTIVKVKP